MAKKSTKTSIFLIILVLSALISIIVLTGCTEKPECTDDGVCIGGNSEDMATLASYINEETAPEDHGNT